MKQYAQIAGLLALFIATLFFLPPYRPNIGAGGAATSTPSFIPSVVTKVDTTVIQQSYCNTSNKAFVTLHTVRLDEKNPIDYVNHDPGILVQPKKGASSTCIRVPPGYDIYLYSTSSDNVLSIQ